MATKLRPFCQSWVGLKPKEVLSILLAESGGFGRIRLRFAALQPSLAPRAPHPGLPVLRPC